METRESHAEKQKNHPKKRRKWKFSLRSFLVRAEKGIDRILFHKLSMRRQFVQGFLVAFILFLLMSGTAVGYVLENKGKIFRLFADEYARMITEETYQVREVVTSDEPVPTALPPLFTQESSVVSAVKRTNPAVVSVILSKDVPVYEHYTERRPLNEAFPDFYIEVPQVRQNGTERQEVGGGSGFFVASDGLIVTNRHVVAGDGVDYTVVLSNGKRYPATVIARDQVLDIALLKISGTGFPYLSLGDSDALLLGQSVIAIGNALSEFENTVSVGIVSGLSRNISARDSSGRVESLERLIQTDAAINPGNSGGPLLDLKGNVIGINVAVAQGSENIGFAIPINSVKTVVSSVQQTGAIVRPMVGVRYVHITEALSKEKNLSVDYGVLIEKSSTGEPAVIEGSPADKSGIKEGDIILTVDGTKIDEKNSFAGMIRQFSVGQSVTLKVLSSGVQKTVRLVLDQAPN